MYSVYSHWKIFWQYIVDRTPIISMSSACSIPCQIDTVNCHWKLHVLFCPMLKIFFNYFHFLASFLLISVCRSLFQFHRYETKWYKVFFIQILYLQIFFSQQVYSTYLSTFFVNCIRSANFAVCFQSILWNVVWKNMWFNESDRNQK